MHHTRGNIHTPHKQSCYIVTFRRLSPSDFSVQNCNNIMASSTRSEPQEVPADGRLISSQLQVARRWLDQTWVNPVHRSLNDLFATRPEPPRMYRRRCFHRTIIDQLGTIAP
ncbi:hypothetical protein C8Q78DRAFT_730387 [Trametes maxima]|nr:hypothetical protein C8Q78DRAFT_730387 [Trametes maxima]